MSEKLNDNHSDIVPVKLERSKKTVNKKLPKTLGVLALTVSVPGVLVALADSSESNNGSGRIIAATDATLNSDAPIDTTTTILVEPDTTTTLLDTTTTTEVVVDTTNPGTSGPDTTVSPETTDTPTTTTPETTLPPLQGLNVNFYENDPDNLINPGDVVTYTIEIENPDPVSKRIMATAGFRDSFAISEIVGIRINGCQEYINDSGPLHVLISDLLMQPGQSCSIEYDVQVVFPDRTLYSYTQIYDNTASKSYEIGSDMLYS